MPKGAQVTIGVDGNSQIAIQFVGDESALLMLIGAVECAKQQLINRIRQRTGDMMWGKVDGAADNDRRTSDVTLSDELKAEYASEEKLPRDKAIEATEYAISVLQLRIDQMKKSPEQAEFTINPTLLQKL